MESQKKLHTTEQIHIIFPRRGQKAKKQVFMKHNRVWARKCHSLSYHFLPIYLIWQLWDEQACLGLAGEGGACGLPRSATPLIAPLTQHSIAGSSYCQAITSSDEDISSVLYIYLTFLTNSRCEDYLWLINHRWKPGNKKTKPTSYHFVLLSITARLSLGSQVNFSFIFQSEQSWKSVNGLNPKIVKRHGYLTPN